MFTSMRFILATMALACVLTANAGEVSSPCFDDRLKSADALWAGSRENARKAYIDLLADMPAKYEPFRSLVIMRLAYASSAADRPQVLHALEQLDYVPEHHALAAREMRAELAAGVNPGQQRTQIPPLPKCDVSVAVSPGGRISNLSDALDEARKYKAAGKSVEIVLAPGVYLQKTTLRLGAGDAGLVIRSADPSQPAVLTGGMVLEKWQKVQDASALARLPEASRHKVLVCDLQGNRVPPLGELVLGGIDDGRLGALVSSGSDEARGSLPVPEFLYKGEVQRLARWPNSGSEELPLNKSPQMADPQFERWNGESDLWIHGFLGNDWADSYQKFERVHPDGKITVVPPYHKWGLNYGNGCVVNALCELDQPGEWQFDSKNNIIYFLPPEGFDPSQCVLSSFGSVLIAEACPHLELRDLGVNKIRGDGLIFIDCDQLLLAGIDIEACSGYGVRSLGGVQQVIHSCTIHGMGRGGLELHSGDWATLSPGDSIVENCRFSDMARINHTYAPAILLDGMGLKVRHNSFTDIPSSALRLETCNVLIELNYFRHCVYESGDQGTTDTFGNPLYRGNIIRWNLFDDIISQHQDKLGAACVRLDDYVSGYMISENIFRRGGQGISPKFFGAVQVNKGTDNYIEGNLIIDWPRAFSGASGVGAVWAKLKIFPWSQPFLQKADWQSSAWQKMYPKLRDLFNGEDNGNYLADNQQFGAGVWHEITDSLAVANLRGDESFHGRTNEALKSVLAPWHPIPVDLIGPYQLINGRR